MKILLINNNTAHLKELNRALDGHDVEIQLYKPGLDFHHDDKDLVILSGGGGEGLEIDDTDHQGKPWYKDEMEFIRSCQKPILGICMGFEVMARAHGQPVPYLGRHIQETVSITTTETGWDLLGRHSFKQVESHSWYVPEVPRGFKELARSTYGVEIMYNPDLRQLGTQFHSELGGSLSLNKLIATIS